MSTLFFLQGLIGVLKSQPL